MNKQDVFAIDKAHYMPVFARYPMVISHGEGAYVTDTDGNRYLDFFAGIAVNALGHAHPNLVKAVAEQAAKVIHCSNLYYTEVQAQLIEKLASLSGLDKVFLANSGAEANEGALKLARKYGKTIADDKYEIITANHCFHGRTLMTLTATAQPKYQAGYEPLPQGFTYIDYNDIAALEAAISDKTCAVVLEPIQGEGGVNVPNDDYLQKVRALCDKHGALLIFDEVQTGIGRTGKMFAYEHFGVKPDIVTLAKGLAGGVPIGAFLATDKVASAFHPGDHGSTFGGNPLACAASKAVLDTILEDKLLDNVNEVGAYLMDAIRSLGEKYPTIIRSVRGKGFMVGIELTREGREIVQACLDAKLIINCTAGNVLRLVPSLTIGKQQVDEMITILDAVLAKQ
ncbi:MAG: acetylornithine transaminase [Selenomonadales bacterium]|nr:acetylornithine transaminase [Selenomonadales bacterium]MBQ2247090.1 acetylornithine transaminase [Selenomonadales bacterium]MBQ5586985.1 acetylornithine transaminase [Selenomonadales bacterium]